MAKWFFLKLKVFNKFKIDHYNVKNIINEEVKTLIFIIQTRENHEIIGFAIIIILYIHL